MRASPNLFGTSRLHAQKIKLLPPTNGGEDDVPAEARALIAHLDDHHRLTGDMEKHSLMMTGAFMQVEAYAVKEQVVGSDRFLEST